MRILIVSKKGIDVESVAKLFDGDEITIVSSLEEASKRIKAENEKNYLQLLMTEGHLANQPDINHREKWRAFWKQHHELALASVPYEAVLVL